jgi:PAS domain S-box-containing protein
MGLIMTLPLKVLILEDLKSDAELMVHELKQAGFLTDWKRVDTEDQYLAALESDPDLILADYSLPQFDAFLALRLMQERRQDIPFIVVSGAIAEELAVEFMKRGASDYLIKDRLTRLGQAAVRALEQRDLRKKKQSAEVELKTSEEKYRFLIENSHDIIYMVERDAIISFVSPSWLLHLGYRDADIIGKSFCQLIHPDDADKYQTFLLKAFNSGESQSGIEYRMHHIDGTWHWFMSNVAPARNINRNMVSIVGIATDISERKLSEENLIKARDDLERKVQDLAKKTEELSRSNAELEQFAYVASHDLQEPLRIVTSYAQHLEKRYKGKLDPEADEFIGFIVEGTKRMERLIKGLLAFSRVGTCGKPFERIETEDVLNAVLQNLQLVLEENRGIVTHDPLPAIVADESQMVEIFQNLIGNGLKFHGQDSPIVHISARREEKGWTFSFKDNGIGIDPQHYSKLFRIFQRLNPRDYPGTGIALSISRKIVERHGGRIWVDSEPGKGSTFYFIIPDRDESTVDGPIEMSTN